MNEINWNPELERLTWNVAGMGIAQQQIDIYGWSKELRWSISGEFSEHANFLEEPGLPPLFISEDRAIKLWRATIPTLEFEIASRIKPFCYALLRCSAEFTEAREMLTSEPLLLALWLEHCKRYNIESGRFRAGLRKKRTALLARVGLDDRKTALKVLGKVQPDLSNRADFSFLKAWLSSSEKVDAARHEQTLSIAHLKFLDAYPTLGKTPVAECFVNASISDQRRLLRLIEDIRQMEVGLLYCQSGCGLSRCTSIEALQQIHDDIVDQFNRSVELKKQEQLKEYGFPPPPLAGTQNIQPIETREQLLEEGQLMNHCVGGYADRIRQGRYFVYRVVAPERATLGIAISPSGVTKIDQLVLRYNKPTSDATYWKVYDWHSLGVRKLIEPRAAPSGVSGELSPSNTQRPVG